jgi:rare lipoprotein A
MRPTWVVGLALALMVGACVGAPTYAHRGKATYSRHSVHFPSHPFRANASYYQHGTRTANGERFVPSAYTAAHRTLPFGTQVRVTNKTNGRSVVVRINDRGPFIAGREIDVSRGAAEALGMVGAGVAPVHIEVLR